MGVLFNMLLGGFLITLTAGMVYVGLRAKTTDQATRWMGYFVLAATTLLIALGMLLDSVAD